LIKSRNKGRHYFGEIRDDPVIGYLKNIRLRVCVNGNDDLGSLDPDGVIEGTANPNANI
jgi:hypothetical protein